MIMYNHLLLHLVSGGVHTKFGKILSIHSIIRHCAEMKSRTVTVINL